MKYIVIFITLMFTDLIFAQSDFPAFLNGTWKMEGREVYEHWDKLNTETLKGFSYTIKEGRMEISEYLDIAQKNNETTYIATVIHQNGGKGIEFRLTESDSIFTFENPTHDFPQKIVYRKLSDSEISVQVSDGKQKGFEYKMNKQLPVIAEKDPAVMNSAYDKNLAEKLKADDYGMKNYIFVILKTGAITFEDKATVNEIFRGHLDNINRLMEDKKLVIAGPLGKNENNYRGIIILRDIQTIDEARELLQTDPAVKNGLLEAEFFNWYSSAALPEYLPISEKIWKRKP